MLHVIASLKTTGKAAVILPHGVLFRGNREAEIRKNLLLRGLIKGVIGFPQNLFYGTGIPACIVVVDKAGAASRDGVFMIDASRGFMKDGPKNRLRSEDIHKIVDVFTRQTEVERYARLVPLSEIADPKNDYDLIIPRYIDSSEPEDLQDLEAHIHGGIPDRDIDALEPYWIAFPGMRERIFKPNREGYSDLAVDPAEVHQTVLDSDAYRQFRDTVVGYLDTWYTAHRRTREAINPGTIPNELIRILADDLLERFKSVPLVDEYDIYEQLMSYWHATMHDDVFLIMTDGWTEAARPRPVINGRKPAEVPDLVLGSGRGNTKVKMDLLPPEIVAARYFEARREEVDRLEGSAQEAERAVEDFVEEHAGEDGALAGCADEEGNITKASVAARLKEAVRESADGGEISALEALLHLYTDEALAKRAAKEAKADLDVVPR